MTSSDKSKLDSYPSKNNSTSQYLRGDGTWQTPPDTNTWPGFNSAGATSINYANGTYTISSVNTTYDLATQSANGLMSNADKNKLDNLLTTKDCDLRYMRTDHNDMILYVSNSKGADIRPTWDYGMSSETPFKTLEYAITTSGGFKHNLVIINLMDSITEVNNISIHPWYHNNLLIRPINYAVAETTTVKLLGNAYIDIKGSNVQFDKIKFIKNNVTSDGYTNIINIASKSLVGFHSCEFDINQNYSFLNINTLSYAEFNFCKISGCYSGLFSISNGSYAKLFGDTYFNVTHADGITGGVHQSMWIINGGIMDFTDANFTGNIIMPQKYSVNQNSAIYTRQRGISIFPGQNNGYIMEGANIF